MGEIVRDLKKTIVKGGWKFLIYVAVFVSLLCVTGVVLDTNFIIYTGVALLFREGVREYSVREGHQQSNKNRCPYAALSWRLFDSSIYVFFVILLVRYWRGTIDGIWVIGNMIKLSIVAAIASIVIFFVEVVENEIRDRHSEMPKSFKVGDKFSLLTYIHVSKEDGTRGEVVGEDDYVITDISVDFVEYSDKSNKVYRKPCKEFIELSQSWRYFRWKD